MINILFIIVKAANLSYFDSIPEAEHKNYSMSRAQLPNDSRKREPQDKAEPFSFTGE